MNKRHNSVSISSTAGRYEPASTIDESGRLETSAQVQVSRTLTVPDPLRVARYRKSPELGPRVLFFSGGTALNPLSSRLMEYTHNSIHLVTSFDSGGSSRQFREAFDMLSVGDLRSRIMALADRSVTGHPEIVELFAHRLPRDVDNQELRRMVFDMAGGHDPLVSAIQDPMRKIIRNHIQYFLSAMPDNFDLRGASIGNIVLVGGYLNNNRHIDPVVFMFSKLVEVRGTVRTIMSGDYHLVAKLENGDVVVGQRQITGKETEPISSRIVDLYITDDIVNAKPLEVEIREKTRALIRKAELIVFPMGSLFSSVTANLLPGGVAEEIARQSCPKVFIPNTGYDPEQFGMSVDDCVAELVRYLRRKAGSEVPVESLVNFIVMDTRADAYENPPDQRSIRNHGVEIIDLPLITDESHPYLDEEPLIHLLLSLV